MPTNPFFNNFNSFSEQSLIEDLIIESIRIYGHDCYFCPRTTTDTDEILNEDTLSQYNSAYLIELYIKNVEGFEGEGDFLSKFNVQINDEITFTVARRTFNEEVGSNEDQDRPNEGDLIYMPLTGKIYVVKFVEHEPTFYQLGALQTYDLKCELFVYSNEKLNTGVEAIDALEDEWSQNIGQASHSTLDANGNIIINANTGMPVGVSNTYITYDADNEELQTESDAIIDFSETNPFAEDGW